MNYILNDKKKIETSKLLLITILVTFVVYPFIKMIICVTPNDFLKIVSNPNFSTSIYNTLFIAFVSAIASILLGSILSFCIQRSKIKLKKFFTLVFTFPMLIPSISLGTGLIVLFGNNGIIRNLFSFNSTIYGYGGVILGSILYSFPVAFLMINDVLKYEDSSPYEAADVLGISKINQFLIITLPYIKRSLFSAFFSTFTMVATDYGVPLMLSGKIPTLAVMLYQEVLGQMNFGSGNVIGIFLLAPSIVAFIYNLICKSNSKENNVSKNFDLHKNSIRDIISYTLCCFASLFILLLFFSFLIFGFSKSFPNDMTLTLNHFKNTFSINGLMYLKNSLLISFIASTIGTILTFIDSYLTTRTKTFLSHVLHLFSITSLAIPGLVLGLAYVNAFKESFIYGTFVILIIANIIHFFASPYLMFHNSLEIMNENIENVGLVLGISRIRIILGVIVPMAISTFIEVFSYFFVNSMMTISAVSFLFSYNTKPLSLAIGQFEAQMQLQSSAIVAFVIFLFNITVKVLVSYFKSRNENNKIEITGEN